MSAVPGGRVAAILGSEVTVPCRHHQSVADAPGFVFSAAAADGTIEAMKAQTDRFRLAVQWHRETGTDLRLFRALAAAAS